MSFDLLENGSCWPYLSVHCFSIRRRKTLIRSSIIHFVLSSARACSTSYRIRLLFCQAEIGRLIKQKVKERQWDQYSSLAKNRTLMVLPRWLRGSVDMFNLSMYRSILKLNNLSAREIRVHPHLMEVSKSRSYPGGELGAKFRIRIVLQV